MTNLTVKDRVDRGELAYVHYMELCRGDEEQPHIYTFLLDVFLMALARGMDIGTVRALLNSAAAMHRSNHVI